MTVKWSVAAGGRRSMTQEQGPSTRGSLQPRQNRGENHSNLWSDGDLDHDHCYRHWPIDLLQWEVRDHHHGHEDLSHVAHGCHNRIERRNSQQFEKKVTRIPNVITVTSDSQLFSHSGRQVISDAGTKAFRGWLMSAKTEWRGDIQSDLQKKYKVTGISSMMAVTGDCQVISHSGRSHIKDARTRIFHTYFTDANTE